jgi:hypothetical protein
VKPLSQSVMLSLPNWMHGPVAFVQTTSQLNRVFSVITRVAGITPHTSFEALSSASSAFLVNRALVEPVRSA